MWHLNHIPQQLKGIWRFERHISTMAVMRGKAHIVSCGQERVSWHEVGQLVLQSGASLKAHRSFIYSCLPDGFCVWFDEPEPRLFHEIHLSQKDDFKMGRGVHVCGADRYDSCYQFFDDGSFSVTHRVTGPRKDYVSFTQFVRHVPLEAMPLIPQ